MLRLTAAGHSKVHLGWRLNIHLPHDLQPRLRISVKEAQSICSDGNRLSPSRSFLRLKCLLAATVTGEMHESDRDMNARCASQCNIWTETRLASLAGSPRESSIGHWKPCVISISGLESGMQRWCNVSACRTTFLRYPWCS